MERSMFTRLSRLYPVPVLLALFTSSAVTTWAAEPLTLSPRTGLNAYAALVDQEFESASNGLRVLAVTENIQSGDWNRIKRPLGLFAKGMPTNAAVWFAQPDGSYFTVAAGQVHENLRDRDYFPRLMAGKEVMGDLVISKSTGKLSAIIAVPVQERGRVIGALGVSAAMAKVAALLDEQIAFPQQIMFYALDARGQIAMHREPALLFNFAAELGSPSLAEAVKEMLSQPEGTVHYEFEGAEREAIFKKSSVTGWVYALRW